MGARDRSWRYVLGSLSWDGIPDIARAETPLERSFWVLIFAGSLCAFVCCFAGVIQAFRSSPMITEIRTVVVAELEFSQVIVCVKPMFNITKINENASLAAQLTSTETAALIWQQYFDDLPLLSPEDYSILRADYLENVLIQCHINYQNFDCCDNREQQSKLTKKKITNAGVCFHMKELFNLYNQSLTYPKAGLSLTIRANTNDTVGGWLSSIFESNGITVDIARDIDVNQLQGVGIKVGVVAEISLRLKRIVRTRSSDIECTLVHGNRYKAGWDTDTCKSACWAYVVRKKCLCSVSDDLGGLGRDDMVMRTNSAKWCEVIHFLDCMNIFNMTSEMLECMHQYCSIPPPCEEWVYAVESMSTLSLNPDRFPNDTRDFSIVYLYFPRMSYDLYTEFSSFTPLRLLNEFGGQMGLFLGGSIITFAQLLFYSVKLIVAYIHNYTRRRAESDKVTPV